MSDVTYCRTCKVSCRTTERYETHLKSALHLQIISGSAEGSVFNEPPAPFPVPPSMKAGGKGRGGGAAGGGGGGGARGRSRATNYAGGQLPNSPSLYTSFVSGTSQSLGAKDGGPTDYFTPASNSSELATPVPKSKGGSNTFCDVCSVQTSGPESFDQHLKGTKHRKMLAKSGGMRPERRARPVKYQAGNAFIQPTIDGYPDALIGLQYVVEFQDPDHNQPTGYQCFLCDAQMDVRNVMAHIMGHKHKHTYLKIHYADCKLDGVGFGSNTMLNSVVLKQFVTEQAAFVAEGEGRHPISVYFWDGIDTNTKPDVHTGARPFKRARLNSSSSEVSGKKQAVTGSSGTPTAGTVQAAAKGGGGAASLLKLLSALENYTIRSEMEAGLVIKIQASLSKSLDAYNNKGTSPVENPYNTA